jgi:hypothetical protein
MKSPKSIFIIMHIVTVVFSSICLSNDGNASQKEYIIFARNNLDKVYPDTMPTQEELKSKLKAFATFGEYEPLTFVIRSNKELKNVQISVKDLVCKSESSYIPKENIDVRIVGYHEVQLRFGPKPRPYRLAPRPLLKPQHIPGGVNIDPNLSTWIWITVHVPIDAKPGLYKSKVTVEPQNSIKEELEIEFNVLPINLIRPKKCVQTVFYMVPIWLSENSDEYWQTIRNDLVDIKEHGFACSVMPNYDRNERLLDLSPLEKGSTNFDFNDIDKFMSIYLDVFNDLETYTPIVYYDLFFFTSKALLNGGYNYFTDEFKELYTRAIRIFKTKWEKEKWPELISEVWDEPTSDPNNIPAASYLLDIVRSEGLKGITHLNDNEYARQLIPHLDIANIHAGNVSESFLKELTDNGVDIWVYSLHRFWQVPKTCGGARFGIGFYSWKIPSLKVGVQFMYNCFHEDPNAVPTLYLAKKKINVYYSMALPGPDNEKIPIIEWEWLREGVDDLKYLATLEALINKAKESDIQELHIKARKAQEVINQIMNTIPSLNYGAVREKKQWWSVDEHDKNRLLIAEEILDLQKSLNQ